MTLFTVGAKVAGWLKKGTGPILAGLVAMTGLIAGAFITGRKSKSKQVEIDQLEREVTLEVNTRKSDDYVEGAGGRDSADELGRMLNWKSKPDRKADDTS